MTGVAIVCYNTTGYITRAVKSVEPYVDKIVLIDYSDNECKEECKNLETEKVKVVRVEKNLGHGAGLNIAVSMLNTEYIITMDSDAELLNPSILAEMRNMLDKKTYAVGRITKSSVGPYVCLYFAMFKRDVFYKYPSFIHSGAPWEKAMAAIKGKMKIKDVPDFQQRVAHEGRATRKIAGHWRKDFGGRDGI